MFVSQVTYFFLVLIEQSAVVKLIMERIVLVTMDFTLLMVLSCWLMLTNKLIISVFVAKGLLIEVAIVV